MADIYLDNASTTFPKPEAMHNAVREFYCSCGVNPGRSGSDLAVRAEDMISGTRKKFSEFFNRSLFESGGSKNPNRLVFTLNATMSLNLVIAGTIEPGDHVITTMLEHNSVTRPVNHQIKLGAQADFIKPDPEGYVDPEDVRKAIKPNTKLVVINHASNVTGTVQDLRAIGKICREAGVPLAVDAAQTAGVLPIDMHECNVSFLCFTGHKALFGPTGTGGICVADDAEIRPSMFGGTGVDSTASCQPEDFPHRLEAGTVNLSGICGLCAGLDWLLEKGLDNICKHEIELLGLLQDGLSEIKGVKIHGTKNLERRVATLSMTIEGRETAEVGALLNNKYHVLVRPGLHCAPFAHVFLNTSPGGTVRFSIGPFNTKEHIETAVKAVAEIAAG